MDLIDTHSHLFALDQPVEDVVKRAVSAGVTRMLCVGSSVGVTSAAEAVSIAEAFDNVWATVGIHPHSAGDYEVLDDLEQYMGHPKVVAFGETGLDFFRDWSPFDAQERLFRNSIAFALNHRMPIVIHCRDAKNEALSILKEMKAHEVGGVFHCYVEDAQFAKELEQIGFMVSFTGVLTFANATALREAAKAIPLEQIMLETDCPYMAPVPYRGKPSEPMHVLQIAQKIAQIKEIEVEQVAKQTTQNAVDLFRLT
jgi:TatD DNase family protein